MTRGNLRPRHRRRIEHEGGASKRLPLSSHGHGTILTCHATEAVGTGFPQVRPTSSPPMIYTELRRRRFMSALVRCPNPDCGHLSRVSHDPPGRVFRCPRCQSKLRGGMTARADSKAHLPPRRRQVLQGQSAAPSRAGSRSAGGWLANWPNDGRSPSLGNDSVPRATALATADSAPGLPFGFPEDLDGLLGSPSLEEPRLEDENPSWSAVLETDSARSSDVYSRLGRYRILGVLGEGQYARVYRGYDPVLERAVALKVLRPGLLRLDKMRERFLSEARCLRD